MLFKEKLLLSNCDSVRGLEPEELRKRFLTGLTFADGVVLSPNALIDNPSMVDMIRQPNVIKYLNEEGAGKLVIRGFGLEASGSLVDYFERLPDNYIISSLAGSPRKGDLGDFQRSGMLLRLSELERALRDVVVTVESLRLERDSLSREIFRRLDDPEATTLFSMPERLPEFRERAQACTSRSDWYAFCQRFFAETQPERYEPFRAEVIDTAYNSLFAAPREGFLQDNIRFLDGVPPMILDAGVTYRALRREIELIQYPIKIFSLISSYGTGELVKFLTDEALGYIEDKATDKGMAFFTRKNWFGMYPRMRSFMGLEIK